VRLVEVDGALADLARENAARNKLSDRVSVAMMDVAAVPGAFTSQGMTGVHHVLMNPPFNDPAHNASPDAARRLAHVASANSLAAWADCAAALLAARGTLTLVWRAAGLSDVLGALAGFGGITILPIHPKPSAAAIRVLVRAVKGSGAPLVLLPPLMLNSADGAPSTEAEAILRGGMPLAM